MSGDQLEPQCDAILRVVTTFTLYRKASSRSVKVAILQVELARASDCVTPSYVPAIPMECDFSRANAMSRLESARLRVTRLPPMR